LRHGILLKLRRLRWSALAENTSPRSLGWSVSIEALRRFAIANLAIFTVFCVACSSHGASDHANVRDHEAGDEGASEMARAESLAQPGADLPSRPELIALAQSIEAKAMHEGAGVRAQHRHAIAGMLLEREWRLEGHEQDAKEAVHLYREASRDLAAPGGCAAALEGALLSGESARDGAISYAELYRAERRAAILNDGGASAASGAAGDDGRRVAACFETIERELDSLAAFRPPARVLDAITEGLSTEGALGTILARDAGARVETSAQIVRVEEWTGEDAARVVVVLDHPAHFRAVDEAGGGPNAAGGASTFVELDGVDVGQVARETALNGIVRRIRAEGTSTGARVSLDLNGRAYRRVFPLLEPYRIVIDIARNPPGATPLRSARVLSRVVLDPGHGGNDPGAIGPAGAKEKDVTLAIAHLVAPVLAAQGIQVTLTRDDDRYVTLEERTARANAFNADLFVSIHCNAAENRSRHGVETYVLDTTKDEIANRVAARENATSQAANAELGSILANMRMADQASRSKTMADLLQRSAMASLHDEFPDAFDGGVHVAGFYVLVGARMPGVLFETSYISNPIEEERLTSARYQQRIADSIVNAIKAYREGH
jgi:N-acetylmuramoyl-L-alanine amidase